MNRALILAAGTLVLAVTASSAFADVSLQTQQDKLSYSMGVMTGMTFRQHNINVNTSTYLRGIQDGISGGKTLMTQDQIRQTLTDFQQKAQAKMVEDLKAQASKNKTESDAFMAANKSKAGVQALPSGVQYKVLSAGTGANPTANSTVTVDYEGKLINGQLFDSSYARGKPATFPLNAVIKGWQEGLQQMKAGSTWMLYIPADLAYGENGAPGLIGPNQALVFKVHLISVK